MNLDKSKIYKSPSMETLTAYVDGEGKDKTVVGQVTREDVGLHNVENYVNVEKPMTAGYQKLLDAQKVTSSNLGEHGYCLVCGKPLQKNHHFCDMICNEIFVSKNMPQGYQIAKDNGFITLPKGNYQAHDGSIKEGFKLQDFGGHAYYITHKDNLKKN